MTVVPEPTVVPRRQRFPTAAAVSTTPTARRSAAGADPIYAGQPGYSRKLDRDGDGVACE